MTTTALEARIWRRFTPAQRIARFAVYLAMVTAVVMSIQSVEVIPEFLLDAPEQMADLLKRMWPVAFSYYPKGVHEALDLTRFRNPVVKAMVALRVPRRAKWP